MHYFTNRKRTQVYRLMGDSGTNAIYRNINEQFTPRCSQAEKLNGYLADIDESGNGYDVPMVEQMADKEGVTEQLKAENPMLWVVRMNEIQARAREIINREIIYT